MTDQIDRHPHRVLRTPFIDQLVCASGWRDVSPAVTSAPVLLRKTMVDGEVDFGIISGGQVTGMIDDIPTVAELIQRVMDEATAVLRRLCL